MENFQTYFPYSSSSVPLNVQANPPHTANFNNYSTEFQDSKSNGYLDLMMPDVQHDPVSFDSKRNIISGNESYLGSENNEETKVEKKKGEKKVRKPRYAFQTRSQVDILDDGYRWRKYGQKAVKNNKFPRSYYRCTHQGCNVKKQVQRLTNDEGVVVTTYEGMHSHPIEKSTDNFEHILSQMQIYASY